jgi:hypothetical protein
MRIQNFTGKPRTLSRSARKAPSHGACRPVINVSLIRLFAVGDPHYVHGFYWNNDLIEDPIIAGSESEQTLLRPNERLDVWMPQWIFFQRLETSG